MQKPGAYQKRKSQPEEYGNTAYLLQAAHVSKGEHFASRIHRDIDAIMEDARGAHRGQSDSASKPSVMNVLKQDLEEAASFNGNKLDLLIMVFYKWIQFFFSMSVLQLRQQKPKQIFSINRAWVTILCLINCGEY